MVGKTSISTRFIQGKFIKIEVKERTINSHCYQKSIKVNNKQFDLNVWDTAGEEKYHAMAPIFYRGAHGAIIIFDVTNRETFEKARKWFQELKNLEKNLTIILVGNKIDLPNREISNEEAEKLAKEYNCEFFEVSALLGTNIDEIFESLAISIYNDRKKRKSNKKLEAMNIEMNNNKNNDKNNKKKFNFVNNNDNIQNVSNRKGSCC